MDSGTGTGGAGGDSRAQLLDVLGHTELFWKLHAVIEPGASKDGHFSRNALIRTWLAVPDIAPGRKVLLAAAGIAPNQVEGTAGMTDDDLTTLAALRGIGPEQIGWPNAPRS